MTYRRLIDMLSRVPSNRLDDDVTIYDANNDEFHGRVYFEIADDKQDVLDEGHVYLEFS